MKAHFKGKSYTINDIDDPKRNPDPKYDLIRMDSCYADKGDLGEKLIHYGLPGGGNSGFQAVNLAYIMGAKTILLLGFDMFGTHFFGKHPPKLDVMSPFRNFIESFASIKKDVEIINCSRQTALDCFPKMPIESVL